MYEQQNAFSLKQRGTFAKKFNRALFTNDGMEEEIKNNAVKAFLTVDSLNNHRNAKTDISHYFDKDPFPGLAARNMACSNVLEPKFLPARDEKTDSGCGWWYVDDINSPSAGANGTESGPYDNEKLGKERPGGDWMWDLVAAQKKEDVKRCRRVKTCSVADLVPGKCGFCPPLNRGVPIRSDKSMLYPNDPALNCEGAVITSPAQCPRPEPAAPARPGDAPQRVIMICDPNPGTGKLSNQCLIQLAEGAGCNQSGAIIDILSGDGMGYYGIPGPNQNKFNLAKKIIKQDTSIRTPPEALGFGVINRSDALGYFSTIVRLSVNASTRRAREAAGFLAIGSKFDECENDDHNRGPFELHCLERVAREAGCQPAGTEFPKDGNKDRYDSMTWKAIRDYFIRTNGEMNSSDKDMQTTAVRQCLGIMMKPPDPECGDTMGVSYFYYKWDYDWNISKGGIPKSIFYGRVSKPTFVEINNNGQYTPFNIGTDRIYCRAKANIISKTGITTRFWVMTDDGIAIRTDNGSLLQKWWDQGPTGYDSGNFSLNENVPKNVEFDWFNNYGGYVFLARMWLDNVYQPIPATMVYQVQPTGFPIARWDFCEGYIDDRCGNLNSQVMGNVPIGSYGHRKCALFNGGNYIQITNGIRTTAYRSITMMIYINSNHGGWPRAWEFNNTPLGGSWCADSHFGCLSPNMSMGVGFYTMKNCNGPAFWSGGGTVANNRWYHVAWILDDDMKGMSMYLEGVRVGRHRDDNFNLLINKEYSNMYIMQSIERFPKDVAVGWFRMFDYGLTADDIRTDRINGWSTDKLFPVSKGLGWDKLQANVIRTAPDAIPPPPPPPPEPLYKGCWGDSGDRALPHRGSNVKNKEECLAQAKKGGFKYFGLQYYGECWMGNNDNWNRFGKRDNNGCGPLGRDWTNQVYQV